MNLIEQISQNIKALRVAAGLSQEELAAKVGVSRSSVARIEAGQAMPSIPTAVHLADALNTTLEALVKPLPPL